MREEEILKMATYTIDSAVRKPEREEDLYTPKERKHPKGAMKVGYDMNYYVRVLNATTINLRGLTFNLLPVLYALGMASKEYLVKYRGLGGDNLRDAIRRDYLSLGGQSAVFDIIATNEKYRTCFTMPTAPERELWPYISLRYVGEEMEKRYPCPLCFEFDAEPLKPEFEIWISGDQVEKRKEQEKIIGELNKFFERGANKGLMLKYFCNFDGNKVTSNSLTSMNDPYKDVMK